MRKRYLLLLVTAGLGFALLAVDRYTREIVSPGVEQQVKEPDYYGDVLISRRYSDTGKLADTFDAATSQHYPDGDLTIFSEPRVLITSNDKWVVTANEGVLKGDSQALNLSGNIIIKPQDAADPWTVKTSTLTYYIDQQLATSDVLVTITGENTVMRGTGMIFDATRQRLELKTGVRTYYEPAK
jgi:LPS export ABC transporter protein LptC